MNMDDAYALTAGKGSENSSTWFKISMPYLFQRLDHAKRKHVYLPLNRNYKTLGTLSREYVDYDAFAETHAVTFSRDPSSFAGVWSNPQPETGRFWLYDDGRLTRTTYFTRLERLMLKHPVVLGSIGQF